MSPPPAATSPAASPSAEDALPPAGQARYEFLLARIPDLVDKVPCACCPNVIGQCYRGACPTSCGPCNRIGKDAWEWHLQGVPDDEVVSRVRAKYGIVR